MTDGFIAVLRAAQPTAAGSGGIGSGSPVGGAALSETVVLARDGAEPADRPFRCGRYVGYLRPLCPTWALRLCSGFKSPARSAIAAMCGWSDAPGEGYRWGPA
jgi:hypothetical protein